MSMHLLSSEKKRKELIGFFNSSKMVVEVAADDSFKKPGAVPFKWEIRPGVPKHQHQQPPSPPPHHCRRQEQQPQKRPPWAQDSRRKLAPPPAGFLFRPHTPEPRSHSFRSAPRTRSDVWRFGRPEQSPEIVSVAGCLPSSPLLVMRKDDGKKKKKKKYHKPEPDYTSDLETLARWSGSARKSLSLFLDSPSPSSSSLNSSSSSYHSSPRPVTDAEWAGFGLF